MVGFKSFGAIAFMIGLLMAAFIAIFTSVVVPTWAVYVLAALGVVVGLMNISDKEILLFLVASVTFLISFQALSAVFEVLAFGWEAVSTFFSLMNVFVAPAAAIAAVKALFNIAKD